MKKILAFSALSLVLSGCSTLISSAANGLAENVSGAMFNQVDPETAKDALPTFIVLLDSFLEDDPYNPEILSSGAQMYATYGAVFADDELRASRLTTRGRRYAETAMCVSYEPACEWPGANYEDFVATLDGIQDDNAELLFTYGLASLAYLRAHASDWNSLAELPKVEAALNRYVEIAGDEVNTGVYTFMGVILTLRPPALGGEPDRAREFFEKAIEVSDGKDLSVKVEYAKGYAKLLYERELHDRLLNEVLEADPNQDGFVLTNVMAQEEAQTLLAEADDYF